ncbi:MAG: hypothetical protein HQL99_02185 [Magnetococcales bacterium]|nr:hypothetical protein [Magnetococcales bacterium]
MRRGCDPRLTLLAFGVLLSVMMSAPLFSRVWWVGCGLVGVSAWAASLSWSFLGRGLFHWRWLLLALLLVHGWMTPGEFLWSSWPFVTREGVVAGVHQALRLLVLAVLAWSVGRVTTPMQLVGGMAFYLGWLERFGVPVARWLSILGFCLSGLGRFREQAGWVRMGMTARLGESSGGGERLERLAFAGSALLSGLLWDLRRREEGLRARGFEEGLPPMARATGPVPWRDWLVPLGPGLLWLYGVLG